ncbi:peptidase inhibitor family I36 protein [Streptomyces sp. NPDC048420]|uniref:peptidase inhibitor family I36 protein n=1 Tax=Streptomyces sp. NPDC048420 TaxID=3155755 RepID=UPI00342291D8
MSHTSGKRRVVTVAAAALAATSLALAAAPVASAATGKNGALESREFGLYYNTNRGGCVFDLLVEDTNFSGDYFKGSGCNGLGQSTNDNAASYWNRDTYTWYVYTDKSAGGVEGWLDGNTYSNASEDFKNEVSSSYYWDAN